MDEDIIGELIRMDREARESVEDAQKKCDTAKAQIEQEAAGLREQYMERADHRVENMRTQVQKDCNEQAAQLQLVFDRARTEFDECFAKNKARWTDEIVERCKQPGLTQ